MQRTLLFGTLLMLSSFPVRVQAQEQDSGGLRYTILVTEFENLSGWSGQWNLGHAWSTVMTDVLNQTGHFIVLGENSMRDEALAEQDFAESGRTAQGSKTPTGGQMTPAQLLLKGAITHVEYATKGGGGGVRIKGFKIGGKAQQAELNASIYVVDSSTGQVVASTDVVGESDRKGGSIGYSTWDWGADLGGFKNDNVGKAMEAAISDSVEWMMTQLPALPWSGSVVQVQNEQVYINRGTREGVSPGQMFVVGISDVIRDPDTGEVLDESLDEVATLRVATVKEKLSICSIVTGDASAIERGMRVQLP